MQSRNSKNVKIIDVSHHNGTINWTQVALDGVKGAYIKLTEGETFVSPKAYENYLGAKNAGLRVGFYHYAHANNDPIKEVDFFLKKLGNMKVDLPHCLDLEENKGKSKAQVNAFGLKWMEYLQKKTGITPILYAGLSFSNDNFSTAMAKYPLWVARYSSSNRVGGMNNPGDSRYWSKWAMFQFTDAGKVKGIKGNVDINEMDLDFFKAIDSGVSFVGDKNPPSSYRKGDSGLGVKELQQNLLQLGEKLPRYGADGSFGDELEQAVKSFQARNKLAVDGIVGPATLAKISELLKPKLEQPSDKEYYRLTTGSFKNAKALAEGLDKLAKEYKWLTYEKANTTELNPTYRIVTGTFQGRNNAEKFAAELKKKFGWTVYISKA